MSREKSVEVRGQPCILRVRSTVLGALGGRASQVGGAETETMGGRIVTIANAMGFDK